MVTDMIKKKLDGIKKLFAAISAAALFVILPVSAFAQSFEGNDYTVEVPDDMYVLTRYTATDDPAWTLAGIGSPSESLSTYQDMNADANFVSEGGRINILLTKKESDYSKSVFNLGEVTEEQRQSVLEYLGQSNESSSVEIGLYDHPQIPFFRISFDISQDDGSHLYEIIYGTIVNGYTLAFDVYGGNEPVSDEAIEIVEGMVDSVNFTNIKPLSSVQVTSENIGQTLVVGGVLLLLVIVVIAYFPIKRSIDKKNKAKLAEKLSEYRNTHGDGQNISGNILFANSTECTNEAIHKFSIYHSYVTGLLTLIFGVTMSVVLIIVAFALDSEWWMKLIAAAVLIFYVYKIIAMPGSIEKVQRKVFSSGPSKVAHFIFYDEAFRVSGIQYTSVYPYLNILFMKKTNDYYYLYYGPDNAYIVSRKGFAAGTDEDFEKFINKKLEENKK